MLEQIQTKRLLLALATQSDLSALEEIEKECDAYFRFDPPSGAEHNRSLRECLKMGDNIPGVLDGRYQRENYYLYCVWEKETLIGWLSLYLPYRQNNTAYLSVLYIKEAHRANGIGGEIMEALIRELAARQYQTIETHCSLRNALSLRFWVKIGFNRITQVQCDGNLYPDKFGGLGLVMNINE